MDIPNKNERKQKMKKKINEEIDLSTKIVRALRLRFAATQTHAHNSTPYSCRYYVRLNEISLTIAALFGMNVAGIAVKC